MMTIEIKINGKVIHHFGVSYKEGAGDVADYLVAQSGDMYDMGMKLFNVEGNIRKDGALGLARKVIERAVEDCQQKKNSV